MKEPSKNHDIWVLAGFGFFPISNRNCTANEGTRSSTNEKRISQDRTHSLRYRI